MRRVRRPLLALVTLVVVMVIGYTVRGLGDSGPTTAPSSGSPSGTASAGRSASSSTGGVALSSLPRQVATTVRLIRSDGPFPYPRNDGAVFHNFQRGLPGRADGYYREYTVPTPGSRDRGARRVIAGRDGEYYYTGDHYDSFVRLDVTR